MRVGRRDRRSIETKADRDEPDGVGDDVAAPGGIELPRLYRIDGGTVQVVIQRNRPSPTIRLDGCQPGHSAEVLLVKRRDTESEAKRHSRGYRVHGIDAVS